MFTMVILWQYSGIQTAKLRSISPRSVWLLYLAVSLDFFRSLDLCSEG
jgi:hypothetical protein